MSGPPARGLSEGLTTSHLKESDSYEMLRRISDFLVGYGEHGNEPSDSIKGGISLD
jgi:hypothetical protein